MSADWPIASLEERASDDDDYEALWRLHVDTMRDYVAATYGWVHEDQEKIFRERWPNGRPQRVLVDRRNIVAAWRVEARADHIFLALVEVAPAHQNRRLGTAIVRRELAAARASHLPLKLTVMKRNPDARRLYESLGFVVSGETPTHFEMIAR